MRGGDAAGQMLCFAFASGVCKFSVMGEPEEIGFGEGRGIEGDVVDGVVGENERAVGGVHGFPLTLTLSPEGRGKD